MRFSLALAVLVVTLARAFAGPAPATGLPGLVLHTEVQVDREGVFLAQLVTPPAGVTLPVLRLLPAPAVGTALTLTRARIQELVAQSGPVPGLSNWAGADRIRVTRRARPLGEAELKDQLTATLQSTVVGERGELELRFARPWTPVQVPDEPLTVRVLDLPAGGLSPLVLLRFELLAGPESAGSWQVLLQPRIWRDIWVARAALRRGQLLDEAAVARERRDILTLREPLADLAGAGPGIEAGEGLQAGAPLFQRHLRLRPVVRRGQSADAILQEGALNLVLRVEVLEDGAPGQVIRLRNPVSRRELRGKVQDEKTIVVGI
jgi:flagella basal body P-ring formation protein FlgA